MISDQEFFSRIRTQFQKFNYKINLQITNLEYLES